VRHQWTLAEYALLRRLYADTPSADIAERLGLSVKSIYDKASKMGLHKSQSYLETVTGGRLRPNTAIGADYRYRKGHVPANKGLRRPGWARGRMRETQFRKGQRSSRAESRYQPIGTERITKDGYILRKVNDDLPLQARWQLLQRLVWIEHHGPIPPSHAVCFRNGNKQDCRIENLELISRADLARRNSIHRYPPALKQVIRLSKKLQRTLEQKREKQD